MTTQKRELPPLGQLDSYPVLPLRDIVVFPHMIVPLFVGREKSIRALEEVMKADKFILLATQKNRRRSDDRCDLHVGHARVRIAAPQTSRRHSKSAGRGDGACGDPRLWAHGRLLRS
jgi:ATP-dependent Lon protease